MRALYNGVVMTATAAFLLLSGCVQAQLQVTPIAKTGHPAALANTLGEKIAAAGKEQVDVLSPTWFAKARASHAKAQSGIEKGIALNAILESIATGNAQLEQALKAALKSRAELADVIKSRDAAISAGAEKYAKAFPRSKPTSLGSPVPSKSMTSRPPSAAGGKWTTATAILN
jgi:OOP family OmpA-OmpF porin